MIYRISKISAYYNNFLQQYYVENKEVVNKSYDEQHAHLMSKGVAWADFFQIHFADLGVEVQELVHNAVPLQRKWAIDNKVDLSGNDLLIKQLKYYQPDIVFIQDTLSFNIDFLEKLRSEIKSVKFIAGHICSPFPEHLANYMRSYDILFACPPLHHLFLKPIGITSTILHHAFDPALLDRSITQRNLDVVFAGSLIGGSYFHDERIEVLESLVEDLNNVQVYSEDQMDNRKVFLKKLLGYHFVRLVRRIGLRKMISDNNKLRKLNLLKEPPVYKELSVKLKEKIISRPVFGKEMIQLLQGTKIGINIHGGIAGEYAANVRMFEVAGAGALLLTDHKKNITDLFEPGKEIVTFSSKEECDEKVDWLLKHPDQLNKIAEAGQARAFSEHTIEKRIMMLHRTFMKMLQVSG